MSRFNNTGGQTTVLLIQNTAAYDIGGTVSFWDESGGLIWSLALATPPATRLGPKQLFVAVLPNYTQLQGRVGSITVTNDGRYGDLKGKTVSLDTANGYSFDTPMEGRAR